MSIWSAEPKLEEINHFCRNTLISHLEIKIIEVGEDFLKATMPITSNTLTPYGVLHGCASVVLAETLAIAAANLCVDKKRYYCVGQTINANYIRPVDRGQVIGLCKPFHIGSDRQIWGIDIVDEKNRRICVSRVTIEVLNQEEKKD